MSLDFTEKKQIGSSLSGAFGNSIENINLESVTRLSMAKKETSNNIDKIVAINNKLSSIVPASNIDKETKVVGLEIGRSN